MKEEFMTLGKMKCLSCGALIVITINEYIEIIECPECQQDREETKALIAKLNNE